MLITLLASLGGGLFRLFPEIISLIKSKQDLNHEKEMFQMQLEADKLKYQANLSQTREEISGKISISEIQSIIEATKAQAVVTGIKFVDAINALMRPLLTFWWCIVLYTSGLIANFIVQIQQGLNIATAIVAIWGPDEKAICASIMSFWFVDRALRKK